MRERKQLTLGDVKRFIDKYPDDIEVSCAVSIVNEDEPMETQEFIGDDILPCVAVHFSHLTGLVFGHIEREVVDGKENA